jgi:hypothetical protein
MNQAIDPDEVIPPTHIPAPGDTVQERDATAKIIARWLDELLQIPGTKFKIGLDPIMALVPGIGDMLSSSVSAVVIIESVRNGVSPSVVARMGLNMLINAVMGIIPGVGPFMTAFFKSNSKNLMLLHEWQAGHKDEVRRGSRTFLVVVVCILCAILIGSALLWALYWWSAVKLMIG